MKRNLQNERDKALLRLDRERTFLRLRNQEKVRIDPPVQRARVRRFRLTQRAQQRPDAPALAAILTELDRTIRAELDDPWWQQPGLFPETDLERQQLANNVDGLRARLADIPAEIAREQAAVDARFASRQTHLFPVAVTWLLPNRLSS